VRGLDQGLLKTLESAIRRMQYELQLPYLALFESLRFAQACRQELQGFDLLYERIGWMAYGSGIASRWLKLPLVLEENGNHLTVMETLGIAPQGLRRKIAIWIMNRAVEQADRIVASGEGWRDHFIERWGVQPERVITIENGTILTRLLTRDQLQAFQTDVSLGKPLTLVYLGGFYPWHGVLVLLAALAEAIRLGANARLIMIGAGTSEEEARNLVDELNLGQWVTFTGSLTPAEFSPILACADVGLSPYCGWVEFSGLKIFDYKAAGLPVIASGKDGRPAAVQHGQTGWIVPPCDEKALSEAIIRLSSDRELVRRMGQQARMEAESRHDWRHTAQKLDQLFRELAANEP